MSLNRQISDRIGRQLMEQWYALYTVPGKEQEAAELLERVISRELWCECRVPRKTKVFRSGGVLHLLEDVMFPGYLFIRTAHSSELSEELHKARKFPQFPNCTENAVVPVEEKDLSFLKAVCGDHLQGVMGVTEITLNEENSIVRADGILNRYLDRIVKLNLHRRFAVVEVELFNRTQKVLFGLKLERDQAG